MSITSTFNSALSGLTAARRSAQVISDNLANALTPGYARRSIELGSHGDVFPGVRVNGIQRHTDPVIIASRRSAEAEHGNASATSSFHTRMADLVGDPTDPYSITGRMAQFDASLVAAASLPSSVQRLDQVALDANGLVQTITQAADGLREMRSQADASISSQVDSLNSALKNVQKMNVRITAAQSSGSDAAALMDQRDTLIDQINAIVPVKVIARDHGQVALYTDGGAILLDGQAATLTFSPTRDTLPHMSVENGLLSGLEINGQPIQTSGDRSAIKGGTLAAQFQVRDELAPEAQATLDAAARDLAERFQQAGLDTTANASDPGLFTDGGTRFDPANETGLANRLAVNTAFDPEQGGESWRLRAGQAAADPGAPSDATLLRAFGDALKAPRAQTASVFGTSQQDAHDVAAGLQSWFAGQSRTSEATLSYASTLLSETRRIEAEQGVDTDAELQNLQLVEQSYAANARVLQAVDELMETLLRL
ncbi:MAG: flagellar hook-associated protein FlgK [Rhodobacteraceae bacterium]|nr:flagellar hook-associated protein FlgK [Paracoccaceae bacterium]